MKQTLCRALAPLWAAAFALGLAGTAAAQTGAPTPGKTAAPPSTAKAEPKDLAQRDDAKCTRCHDESEEYPVLAIAKTRHGVKADARTPTCTNCHGASESHMKKLEGQPRAKPDRLFGGQLATVPSSEERVDRYFGLFGKKTFTPVEERNASCMECHQGSTRVSWQASTHANRDVACTNCHQIHVPHDRVRERETQTELCFSCHKEQRAQLNRPSHHPVPEGKMACSSCHNVHGDNPMQLVKASVTDTCYTCHAEKRGPFVHSHPPVQEDCSICHNPHGTTAPFLQKARQPFLCQECHSSSGHPVQAAVLPNARTTSTSLLGSVGRGCTNCHTNIHGGNSTQNNATAGRFRR